MLSKTPASPDFQALILCGPGVSFNTFTSTPEDFPKALIPIANRPMIWYPLDWCHRMNVTRITLITPPSSCKPIEDALSRDPHLTSLPLPKADVLAPEGLSQNTGTAEILRLPQVQAVITGHFLVLPCDLITDLPGESLLETWMVHAAGMVGSSAAPGGLGVWFPTRGGEQAVKEEETNFLITAQLPHPNVTPSSRSLRPALAQVVYSSTTDTLKDITDAKKAFPIRHGLLRKHGRIRMLTTTRDAHIYLFPYWILDFINRNPKLDSLSEDVVGWWAKAAWQNGLVPKLGLDKVLAPSLPPDSTEDGNQTATTRIEHDLDIASLSTTHISNLLTPPSTPSPPSSPGHKTTNATTTVPAFLSYLHSKPSSYLLRRVDTPTLLLSLSLHLASLPPNSTSPLAHPHKIHPTSSIAPRTTISPDTLIAANTSIAQFANLKASVIGSNCIIKEGVKLTRCVVLDDVEIGEKSTLIGCVVGWRSRIGKDVRLGEGCEVAPGYVVEDGTVGDKGEVFRGFEGLDEAGEDEEMGGSEEGVPEYVEESQESEA